MKVDSLLILYYQNNLGIATLSMVIKNTLKPVEEFTI